MHCSFDPGVCAVGNNPKRYTDDEASRASEDNPFLLRWSELRVSFSTAWSVADLARALFASERHFDLAIRAEGEQNVNRAFIEKAWYAELTKTDRDTYMARAACLDRALSLMKGTSR